MKNHNINNIIINDDDAIFIQYAVLRFQHECWTLLDFMKSRTNLCSDCIYAINTMGDEQMFLTDSQKLQQVAIDLLHQSMLPYLKIKQSDTKINSIP
jgi:hypothetical protein